VIYRHQFKFNDMLKNLNALTSILAVLIYGIFTANGVHVDFEASDVADLILSKEGIALATSLFMLLWTPIFKTVQRVKASGWGVDKLKSRNFALHLTAALGVIAGLVFDAQTAGFVVALVSEAVNWLWHRLG
jgi:hypothetical protein